MSLGIEEFKEQLSAAIDAVPPGVSDPLSALYARERRHRNPLKLAWARPDRGRDTHRRRLVAAIGFAVVIAVAAVAIVTVPGASHGPRTQGLLAGSTGPCPGSPPGCGSPEGTASALAAGRWSSIPGGPLSPRHDETYVWTGSALIIWGGVTTGGGLQIALSDGAAYNPSTRTWRLLPSSPLSGRANASAVWTGTEVIIWGGEGIGIYGTPSGKLNAEGASYTPSTNTWKLLPDAPIESRNDATLIWTGRQMIAFAGQDAGGNAVPNGAVYDPESGSWNALPTFPRPHPAVPGLSLVPLGATAVWTGDELLAWVSYDVRLSSTRSSVATMGAVLHPGSATWDLLTKSSSNLSNDALNTVWSTAVWTGSEVLLFGSVRCFETCNVSWPSAGTVYAFHPDSNMWTKMTVPTDPIGPVISTGRAIVIFNSGELLRHAQTGTLIPHAPLNLYVPRFGLAFDIATAKWLRLPVPSPSPGGDEVWTGRQFLFWWSGGTDSAASYLELVPR
jgi:hypothetical protein